MVSKNHRGQCIVEIALILLIAASIMLWLNILVKQSRGYFQNSTLSREAL